MKRILLLYLALLVGVAAHGAEIGFSAFPLASYQGNFELFTGQKASLTTAGVPFALFVQGSALRVQYLHYEQFGTDEYNQGGVVGDGSVHVENDALIVAYPISLEVGPDVFANGYGGLGVFRSRATAEAMLTDGVSLVSLAGNLSSSNQFDIGFVAGAGVKRVFDDHLFVGVEGMLVVAQTKLKGGGGAEQDLDLGGVFAGITAGATF